MNRFRSQFLLIIFALVLGSYAQTPQPAHGDQTEANLRRTIEYLASDKLEGRRTGEPGADLAANYIEKKFASIGLKPAITGKDGKPGYLQPFPYITGVEMAKTGNAFVLDVTIDENRLKLENMLPVKPVGYSPNGTLENFPVVYAGYGITSKDPTFDDYASVNVQGKIVLVFDGYPDNDNPHSPYGRFDVRTKALIAKEHGAVGMLIISREDNFKDERLARLTYDQSLGESAVPTSVIGRDLAAQLLGLLDRDLKTLEDLTAKSTVPDERMLGRMRSRQPTASFSVNLVKRSVNAYNVIGVLPGTDPTLKNEAIVIGAHYDHLGHGGQGSLAANSTEIHHGADDNASGVAAIIELARQFAHDRNNKRTLIFIAFSGEEEGLFGSNFYVNNPVVPLDKTIAMINLDMVGRLKDSKLTIAGIGTATQWKGMLERTNETAIYEGVPGPTRNGITRIVKAPLGSVKTFELQLNEDGFGPSDHSSFYSKKIPVLFFFTGTHNDYHKPSDTADKINYSGEHEIIGYIADIERTIDQTVQRPTYTVAKTTMQGGRSGFNISLGTIPNYADSNDGLLLDGIRDDSPAARAGVKAGDKVVRLAGHDIRNVMDYTFVLGEMKAGEEYEMVVLRGGERLTLKIVPVKR
jgi:aminopeptidase YwaD